MSGLRDASTIMADGDQLHSRNARGCHRCSRPWRPGEMHYLVRGRVPFGFYGDGSTVVGSMPEVVSICRACLKPSEHVSGAPLICPGCAEPMQRTARCSLVRTCSSRCAQRERRARRRRQRPLQTCTTCSRLFAPTRADAVTCSPACRQRAYRQARRRARAVDTATDARPVHTRHGKALTGGDRLNFGGVGRRTPEWSCAHLGEK